MRIEFRKGTLLLAAGLTACGGSDGAPAPHGAPVALVPISGMDQTAPAGSELPNPVVVKVVDSAGVPVPGQIVNFVVTAGGGHVFAGSAITNSNGKAQERWTLGPVAADSQRLEARAVDPASGDPLVFAHFSAIATVPPAASVALVTPNAIASYAGSPTRVRSKVLVKDHLNHPVAGVSVSYVGSAGTTVAASAVTDSLGIATAPIWTLSGGSSIDTLKITVDTFPVIKVTATHVAFNDLGIGSAICALRTSGQAFCWGNGQQLSLGTGDTITSSAPRPVAGGHLFTALAVGSGACGLTSAGVAWCWGGNYVGEVGDGSTTPRLAPVQVAGGHTFQSIAVEGAGTTCGVSTGQGYCWGGNNNGQLGLTGSDSMTDKLVPTLISGGLTWSRLSPTGSYSCGLDLAGTAYCWGFRHYGGLGQGDTLVGVNQLSGWVFGPHAVVGSHTFTALWAGPNAATCGLIAGGAAYCWGNNYSGQGGFGYDTTVAGPDTTITINTGTPTLVKGGLSFAQIGLGQSATCGVTTTNSAYCWGQGGSGELGSPTAQSFTPIAVSGGYSFVKVAVGGSVSCGLDTSGKIYCWGAYDPEFNDPNDSPSSSTPVLILP